MAPKSKKGKKGGDDWDEGLGETVDPIAQAEADAKAADAAQDQEEDADAGGGGGGLMAMLKKNREKRKKKGKTVENDFLDGEDPPQENGGDQAAETTEAVDLSAKAPVEASMEDEDLFDAPVKGMKGGKGGKQQAAKSTKAVEPEAAEDDDDGEEAGGKVKTKAEKEREKKEREKQRKKDNAASKKKTTPAAQKEEPEIVEAAPVAVEEPAAGGKKKKLNPALAALQKQQDELRRQQEEDARATAEAKAREEEEIRRAEEEEQHLAEQKAARKAKDKAKVEQQKREGTYKTEKQRKEEAQKKLRLQQMLESGAKVAGISDATAQDGKDTAKKDRKVDKKRKDPRKEAAERKAEQEKEEEEARKKMEELKLQEQQATLAAEAAEKARADAEGRNGEDSDEEDDWEVLAEKAEADTKDSWEDDEEEEDTGVEKAGISNGKPIHGGAAGKKAQGKQSNDAADETSSEEDSDDESESEDEQQSATARQAALRRQQASDKRKAEVEAARNAASTENLRSPICCILGHVDTGKTKLLDKIRQTNVQEGEAGGITQQIGATYFPVEALRKKTAVVNADGAFEFKVPGLLVIDTPGHESFTNLRSRGSSLCNIAILVVDIMHGLEPQTLESMRLLRDRKTPFIVALNKIDRLYGWNPIADNGFRASLDKQKKHVQDEFRDRLEKTKLAFMEQSFNAELFYENKSMAKYVSLVPTSAHTGEGIPDMIKLLVTLTQERMTRQLMYLSEVECTVLEVKVIEGLGTTIDVILNNGVLHEGDTIVLCGTEGPITTQVRALLTPAEMKELRVKSVYVHNKTVKAALGVKITANGLDTAIAGSRLLVAKNKDDEDEIEELEEDVMGDLENLMSRISRTGRGVTVQASTLGSLEALLEFLKQSKIPVSSISIGPVHKRDVITASTMLEKAKEYAVMLCFDVKVDRDATELAEHLGVKIFTADIIYHLFDDFTKHMKALQEQKKEDSKMLAVFPCVLRPVAVFNKKDPIVIGVDVVEGNLRMGTPLAAVKMNPVTNVKDIVSLGRVISIQRDHKDLPICKKGSPSVAIKIEGANQPMYGRQLEEKDALYSQISRASIDCLKEFYRDEVDKEEWGLIAKHLKGLFDIP
ncbi:eukaryotic translation initiation factor 5B [Friedmanniomyces endolithicus]|nr:eukaryotic translation initiation factor 5B [Friedmanniomyces endolithicus]